MARIRRVEGVSREEVRFRVWLGEEELETLRSVPRRLREVLEDPRRSPRVIDRLFPPAHTLDAAAESEYRRLMGDTMLAGRRSALEAFEGTLAGARGGATSRLDLGAAELGLWLHVVNDLRLMLATELDIEDNDWQLGGRPRAEDLPAFIELVELTEIQQAILDALP